MKLLARRPSFAALLALALVVLAAAGTTTMAFQNRKHLPQITDLHYFSLPVTPGTADPNDQFMIVATLMHNRITPNTVLKATAVSAMKDSTGKKSAQKDLPLPASTDMSVTAGDSIVAIFRFKRSDLPTGFDPGNAGTGAYTITVTDPMGTTIPDSTATTAPVPPCRSIPATERTPTPGDRRSKSGRLPGTRRLLPSSSPWTFASPHDLPGVMR